MKKLFSSITTILVLLSILLFFIGKDNKGEVVNEEQEQTNEIVTQTVLSKEHVLQNTIKQLKEHVEKFNDEDLLFFVPKLPDNFEAEIKINDLGTIYLKVWDKENKFYYDEEIIKKDKQ